MLGKLAPPSILVLVLVGASCGGSDEATSSGTPTATDPETAATTPADTPPSVVISSGSETVSIGGGIPENFPETFPLPDGVTVAYSASAADGFLVWFGSDQSIEDLKPYFDDALPANGWTVDSTFDYDQDGASYRAYTINGNGYTGGVFLGEGAPGTESFQGDFAFFVTLTPT